MKPVLVLGFVFLMASTFACGDDATPESVETFAFEELEAAVWTQLRQAVASGAAAIVELSPEELEEIRVLRYATHKARKAPDQKVLVICEAKRKGTEETLGFGAVLTVASVNGNNVRWIGSGPILIKVVAESRWAEGLREGDYAYTRENNSAGI